MKNKLKGQPQRATSTTSSKKIYLEFELTPVMLSKIKALARQTRCTPFEMCVELIRERIAARRSRVR